MSILKSQSTLWSWFTYLGRAILQTRQSVTDHKTTEYITIQPGEVCQLDAGYRTLRVISGWAWIAQDGRDWVLSADQQVQLTPDRNGTLITSLRNQSVTIVVQ
jgi:hypothetical protein